MALISILLSVGIVGAGIYVGLPYLYPNLTANLDEYAKTENVTDEGILLESISATWDSEAVKYDNSLTVTTVPDTELNITVEENHRIHAEFTGALQWLMNSGFSGSFHFQLILEVEGVGGIAWISLKINPLDLEKEMNIEKPLDFPSNDSEFKIKDERDF